jgi:glycosyltransferase involved in cell wall biosynthesis
MPDVSVVIPTFRRPVPLAEAIRSALTQDVDVEVLVLDDSPEGSARDGVAAIGDDRIVYRNRAVPSGGNPAVVRNDGWPGARGRYVHFLDDDDRVAPGAYRDVLAAFERAPDRGVVFGRIEPFGDDAGAVARERRVFRHAARKARLLGQLDWRLGAVANQLYASPTLLVNSACLIRREHVAALGGYDPAIQVVEDVEFYMRAIRAFGFVYLDRVIIEYRTGAPSLMNAADAGPRVNASYQRMYEKYRAAHGAAELLALKVVGKGLLRWV